MDPAFAPGAPAPGRMRALESHMREVIPLTVHMGVTVTGLEPGWLELSAPLAPNSNHKGTAFGGSLQALATLACWGLAYLALRAEGLEAQVVVARAEADFLRPVTRDFAARALYPGMGALRDFLAGLRRRGKARLGLEAAVAAEGGPALRFRGDFVAVSPAEGAAG